jgi:hypothetical protein
MHEILNERNPLWQLGCLTRSVSNCRLDWPIGSVQVTEFKTARPAVSQPKKTEIVGETCMQQVAKWVFADCIHSWSSNWD